MLLVIEHHAVTKGFIIAKSWEVGKYYPHFIDGGTEAQGELSDLLKVVKKSVSELRIKPRSCEF